MAVKQAPFTELLSKIVDNRGRTCPTADTGLPLIATNCVKNDLLYPAFEKVRYVSDETYKTWFRGHPEPGDIIFVCKGSPGRVCLTPAPVSFCIAQDMVAVRADPKKVYPRYLFAVLRSPAVQAQIVNMHVGTLIPHFKKGDFGKLILPVPDRATQETIGDMYFELSAKIELNRRLNETLEGLARALFQSWFVDFDPVRAKASGQSPAGLPPAVADLFPDRFQDSELGQIPKGWATRTIDDIAKRVGMGPFGSSIKVETFVSQGVPVISGQHLRGIMLEDNTFNFITSEHAERLKNSMVERGDIIFTHAGNIGQAAFIPENSRFERYIISQRQFFMRCDPTQVTSSFITFFFKSPEGQHRLLANTSSSGVPSIARPVTYVRTIRLVVPPKNVLNEFEQLVRPMLFQFRQNQLETETLSTLRDFLLPKLLSGEMPVPESDNVLTEVL